MIRRGGSKQAEKRRYHTEYFSALVFSSTQKVHALSFLRWGNRCVRGCARVQVYIWCLFRLGTCMFFESPGVFPQFGFGLWIVAWVGWDPGSWRWVDLGSWIMDRGAGWMVDRGSWIVALGGSWSVDRGAGWIVDRGSWHGG